MDTRLTDTQQLAKFLSAKRWLVIYTRPRWEKKVDQCLQQQGIESYCPVRKVISQWADRKKEVELPLFSSYVFVRINSKEELRVRQTQGVSNFIYYLGRPAMIRDKDMDSLKSLLVKYSELEVLSLNELSVGDRVSIKSGALQNQPGKVIKVRGRHVLMVLDHLDCAVVTRVEASNLTLIN